MPSWRGCSSITLPSFGVFASIDGLGLSRFSSLLPTRLRDGSRAKKSPAEAGLDPVPPARSGDRGDPRGLRALRALHDLEGHALAFLQGAKAGRVDRGKVHEDVLAPVLRCDETES